MVNFNRIASRLIGHAGNALAVLRSVPAQIPLSLVLVSYYVFIVTRSITKLTAVALWLAPRVTIATLALLASTSISRPSYC